MAATARRVAGFRWGYGFFRVVTEGVIAASLTACGVGSLRADGTTATVALSGDLATAGGQTFTTFQAPAVNAVGQAAFFSNLNGNGSTTPNQGIFVASGGGTPSAIALQLGSFSGGSQTFTGFGIGAPAINASGQAAFTANLSGNGVNTPNGGIFVGSGGGIPLPVGLQLGGFSGGSQTFTTFSTTPAVNAAGQAAFFGFLNGNGSTTPNAGIFVGSGGGTPSAAGVVLGGFSGGAQTFTGFVNLPAFNASGQAAFFATLNGNGSTTPNSGIFVGVGGGTPSRVALQLGTYSGGGPTFNGFGPTPAVNAAGQAAFIASLNGNGSTTPNIGLFVGSGGGTPSPVALALGGFSGGAQTFNGFGSTPVLNAAGQAAFFATLNGNGSTTPNQGIFVGSGGGTPSSVALQLQPAPDHNGVFSSLGNPGLNAGGTAVFLANLSGTSGGNSDSQGVYLADAQEQLQVAREGQPLAGSTIIGLNLLAGQDVGGRSGLNDFGQVAYAASLANGKQGLFIFTPTLHYRAFFGGNWDAASNWTVGLAPAAVHDVIIDPLNSATLTGPAGAVTVKSLTIGARSFGSAADLSLSNTGGSLTVLNGLAVQASGKIDQSAGALTVQGMLSNEGSVNVFSSATLTATALNNVGNLALAGGTLGGGALTNDFVGNVSGRGTLNLPVTNNGTITATGTLAVNALMNTFTGVINGNGTISGPVTNNGGLVQATAGSTLVLGNLFGGNVAGGELRVEDNGRLNVLSLVNPFNSSGTILLKGPGALLAGTVISNTGTVRGQGQVSNAVLNAGVIRPEGGQLTLAGAGNTNASGGQIQVGAGNTVFYAQGLANNAGTIALSGGAFDNNNLPLGNSGVLAGAGTLRTGALNNTGMVSFADAATSVFGAVNNNTGGTIKVTSNTTTFFGAVTNNAAATFKTTSATARFLAPFTNNGTFISDPADNVFTSLLVGPGGALVGGAGDRFFVSGDLDNGSTLSGTWDTRDAQLHISGSPSHVLTLPSVDRGASFGGYDGNFAWGSLELSAGEGLALRDADSAPGAALYIGELVLDGGVGQVGLLSTTDSDVNVYYDATRATNAYLGSQAYSLEGGGMLIPVPEPAVAWCLATAVLLLPPRCGRTSR